MSATAPLLELLELSFSAHGWSGRMFGARQWLRQGRLADARAASCGVVVIRRPGRPGSPCEIFDALEREGIPFQRILVDVPATEEGGATLPAAAQAPLADAHLVLSPDAPWYTALNLGAACAAGELIVFLNGAATPQPGLLAAYRETFQRHPETLAARGVLSVPGLDGCARPVAGSFTLDGGEALWPVDLEENMAVRAATFFDLGGFDESLLGGCGALDFSIRLWGKSPDFRCQRFVPRAKLVLNDAEDTALPLEGYLLQRQRAWLQLNDSLKRYLELYGRFWQEHGKEERP